jgi:predicted small lipoprotein YifL
MRTAAFLLLVLLAACGQKGALTLPDKNVGGVVTRPTQTPTETPPPTDETQKKKDDTDKKP